jgi:hypothetical protein
MREKEKVDMAGGVCLLAAHDETLLAARARR